MARGGAPGQPPGRHRRLAHPRRLPAVTSAGAGRRGRPGRVLRGDLKSTVPVGDGRWSVSLATGYLERGDGRPLAERDGARAPRSVAKPPRAASSPIICSPRPRGRARNPATGPFRGKPGEELRARQGGRECRLDAVDPAVEAAVTILHQALVKR